MKLSLSQVQNQGLDIDENKIQGLSSFRNQGPQISLSLTAQHTDPLQTGDEVICGTQDRLGHMKQIFAARKSPCRILLVDDQQFLLLGLKALLNQLGNVKISEATNGKEAIEILDQCQSRAFEEGKKIEYVFMDI